MIENLAIFLLLGPLNPPLSLFQPFLLSTIARSKLKYQA
ncbi:hypothetical protein CWATWH0401_3876 [Crocosphaera watsonii WH 0401]|uniref:Uncharacterized protein n=1 Tax=Crocosphaera watsonii WH 0401 TaxID=555881 RepID=T2J3T8_CROWT|nr:hypothetical protein CWATWH0401_3876 [Crocosphaera watsonii WH 0401]